MEKLQYDPDREVVRYQPKKGTPGFRRVIERKPLEFLRRFADLIPPSQLHLVRYYGALGPISPLRSAVTWAAREKIVAEELLKGVAYSGVAGAVATAKRESQKVVSAACRAWASCLRRIFEIDPLACPSCGGGMLNEKGPAPYSGRCLLLDRNTPCRPSVAFPMVAAPVGG